MPPEKSPSSAPPPATVLVVDDNEDTVAILTRLLARNGLKAIGAQSGRECLKIVRSRTIDVVLLDVMMPEMDGLEVCKELKQIAPSLPVILLTAKDDIATRAAGMALGVSEFIAKPVNNSKDLLARIQTQIDVGKWERETDRTSAVIDPQKPDQ